MKQTVKKEKRPLIRLTLIVVPTIVVVIATLIVLNANGFFTDKADKLIGTFTRTRTGEYSQKTYSETYIFNSDNTGTKAYLLPNDKTTFKDFTWEITEKNILVIDGHIKYYWNAETDNYYAQSRKSIKKYWYVTKDALILGQNNTVAYEEYAKTDP